MKSLAPQLFSIWGRNSKKQHFKLGILNFTSHNSYSEKKCQLKIKLVKECVN